MSRRFDKLLVANRGEIALRVIRAARELGLRTVAVYSTADADSLHVKFADEAVCIGPPSPKESYLSVPALIAAAEISGAQAIHPGYGFLAENPGFAQTCCKSGFVFVGPSADAIRLMGNKIAGRRAMAKRGLPSLPGSEGRIETEAEAHEVAERIGFPVIIKAAAGGGGRGMRIVREPETFARALATTQTEALAAFGDGAVYVERYIERPRHIEIQIAADEHGNVVHLFERECSVQRRYQKIIEEAPSPALTEAGRAEIGAKVVEAVKSLGYQSLGTVELIRDEDGALYFMEMNTRVQVEHPVTEMLVRRDLVRLQLMIAQGEPLPFSQEDVHMEGHAIECRINAEDPETFAPSPGRITELHVPGGPGLRVDTHLTAGATVPPHYDSLVAKLIVHDVDRAHAIRRMQSSLRELVVEGIRTNRELHRRVLAHEGFLAGDYDTTLIARMKDRP